MPSTPLICSSIGVATVSAMTFGFAPGILRAHHDRGRNHLGVFRDRHVAQRQQAADEDQNGNDGGEDRPVDEEFG
jgi:hypothetical protein